MFKSFWFYFNAIPVAFSILFFSINLLFVWDRLKLVGPSFSEAVEHCKDVSNNTWAACSNHAGHAIFFKIL